MSHGPSNATKGRSRGQSLVEFSLVVPIFFLMIFGLIDGGRLVFANNTLSQDAHEAARLAAVEAPYIGSSEADCDKDGGPTCPSNGDDFHADVLAAANGMNMIVGTISSSELEILCSSAAPADDWSPGNDCSTSRISGNFVSVRITVSDFEPLMPLWGWFYPSSLSANATMVIP